MWEFLSAVFQFINLLFNCVQSVMYFMYCTLYLKCDFSLLYINNWFFLIFICSYFIYIYVYLKYFLTLFIDNITSFYTFRLCHFFFHLFLLVGGQPFHNIVVGFVIHWHESAMELHVFPIPILPPTSFSTWFRIFHLE